MVDRRSTNRSPSAAEFCLAAESYERRMIFFSRHNRLYRVNRKFWNQPAFVKLDLDPPSTTLYNFDTSLLNRRLKQRRQRQQSFQPRRHLVQHPRAW